MGVLRMAIDVRQGRLTPAGARGAATSDVDIVPLEQGEPWRALAAAVAASCGLCPAGFLAELAGRPGRRVQGWGAVGGIGGIPRSSRLPRALPTTLAGVTLLAETSPSGGGPPWRSIPWLLVRPESRRSGVGRALVAAALDQARGLGACQVTIDTLDRWPEAVAFWRSVGFKPAHPAR